MSYRLPMTHEHRILARRLWYRGQNCKHICAALRQLGYDVEPAQIQNWITRQQQSGAIHKRGEIMPDLVKRGLNAGYSARHVADALGLSIDAVYRWWRRAGQENR